MAKTDDDFLTRWSRRKRGEHPEEPAPESPDLKTANAVIPEAESEDQGDPEVMAQLPDIDGMDDSSDFTVFLQKGVPEALRRRALRKLWRVNPVLANLDGLNDYDEDYTQLSTWGRGMKTAYRVGKGFLADETDAPPAEAPASDAPPLREDPESPPAAPDDLPLRATAAPVPSAAPGSAPAESAGQPPGTARGRRWGTPDGQN